MMGEKKEARFERCPPKRSSRGTSWRARMSDILERPLAVVGVDRGCGLTSVLTKNAVNRHADIKS